MTISNCINGVERRGNVYYLRWRVPARFRPVEARPEINQSLNTRDLEEARLRACLKKKVLKEEWHARLLQKKQGPSLETFRASIALLEGWGMSYKPMEALLSGPLEDLVARIEKVATVPTNSAVVPSALGACDVPYIRVSEMPQLLEDKWRHKVRGKNRDQRRQWRNRYRNAASTFIDLVSDKPMHEITEEDARLYHKHWQDRVDDETISDDLAVKRLRYLRQMIGEYHDLAGTLPSQFFNPMEGFAIRPATRKTESSNQGGKRALPAKWVEDFVNGRIAHGHGIDEAADIGIIVADTGCRQTEIVHLPPEDIRLDDPIPHVIIRYVEDGEHCRDIKNIASARKVPLLGASLDAMRRHPTGFSRYRGKGTFSATVNNHLRHHDLFPEIPAGEAGAYTFGGTRHTWEDRARAAGLDNEERAFLLGHAVGKLRNRPVYGDGPDLRLRALYAELVAFPTETWNPRPQKQVWKLIGAELRAQGFRTE